MLSGCQHHAFEHGIRVACAALKCADGIAVSIDIVGLRTADSLCGQRQLIETVRRYFDRKNNGICIITEIPDSLAARCIRIILCGVCAVQLCIFRFSYTFTNCTCGSSG